MQQLPDVSVVIVSYNTRVLLNDCLNTLPAAAGALRLEVFVVENGSADGSAELIAGNFPEVRLICSEENRGFAAANNIALRQATGRYQLLLNPDTLVRPGAIETLVQFMDAHPRAGYAGPRLCNPDGTHQRSACRFHTWLSDVLPILGWATNARSRHTVDLHALHGDTATFPAQWMVGACLLVRAEASSQVGLLDERFFLYFEEVDWCRRLAAGGWEGWYVGAAEVLHHGCQSVSYSTAARPFGGHDPAHHIRSFRSYTRRYFGSGGLVLSTVLQTVAYAAVWVRNCPLFRDRDERKSRNAAAAIYYLWSV